MNEKKFQWKCDCGEKAITTFQLLNGEIIDVCYECFKILVEERNNVKPKVLAKVMKGNNK